MNANDVYGNDAFATDYAKRIESNAHNSLYERPATESMILDDLKGKKALDLGCGPGVYIASLVT